MVYIQIKNQHATSHIEERLNLWICDKITDTKEGKE